MRPILALFILCLFISNKLEAQLIPIQKDGKWGYCNQDLEMIIPAQYDAAYPFYEGRALIEIYNYETDEHSHRACFINPQGEAVFCWDVFAVSFPASRFQDGLVFIENYQYKEYQPNTYLAIVDTSGNILQSIPHAALDFNLSMYYEYGQPFDESGVYVTPWMSEDSMGTVLIYKSGRSPKYLPYQSVTAFKDGMAIAHMNPLPNEDGYPTALIDTLGKVLIKGGKYRMIPNYDNNTYGGGQYIVVEQNAKYGYIHPSGELIIDYQFDNARAFSEGMAAVGKIIDENEYSNPIYRWGYIDTTGALVIDYQFHDAHRFSEGLAEVLQDQQLQFIDPSGKVVFEFEQDPITEEEYNYQFYYGAYVYEHIFKDGMAVLYVDDQIGWIDSSGQVIIPPLYLGLGRIGPSNIVEDFSQGLSKVMHPDGSEFYIDPRGKQYYLPSPLLLAKTKEKAPVFDNPSSTEPIDDLDYYNPIKLLEKKGKWLKIQHYNANFKYVKAKDYYHRILATTSTAYLMKQPKQPQAAAQFTLPPNSRLYLAEDERPRKVGRKRKWVKVIYQGYEPQGYELQNYECYIRGDQLRWLAK